MIICPKPERPTVADMIYASPNARTVAINFLRELDAFKMPVTKFNALLKLVKKILPLTVAAIKSKPLNSISV